MKFYRIVKENLKTNKKKLGDWEIDDPFKLEMRVRKLNKDNKVKAIVFYVEEKTK